MKYCFYMQTLILGNSQELSRRADRWFADRTLALCFKSWSDFTLQRRLHKQRSQEAEGYSQFVITFTSALYFFFPQQILGLLLILG